MAVEQPKIKLYWYVAIHHLAQIRSMTDQCPNRLEKSRAQSILWLLEELKLEYELEVFHRDKETMRAPAELKKVHALGKSRCSPSRKMSSISPPTIVRGHCDFGRTSSYVLLRVRTKTSRSKSIRNSHELSVSEGECYPVGQVAYEAQAYQCS